MAIQPFDSQSLCPWNETGYVLTSVRTAGNLSVTLPRCAFYPKGDSEAAASGGRYVISRAVATFGFSDLGETGITPKIGDLLTPPGKPAFKAYEAKYRPYGQNWRLGLVRVSLQVEFTGTATIRRPTSKPGEDMLRTATWSDLATDVPCHLHPDIVSVEPETLGGLTSRSKFIAYLGTVIVLAAGDVIDVGGEHYIITRQRDIDQLAKLTSVECEQVN